MSNEDICWMEASQIVEGIRSGLITAAEVVEAILQRIDKIDGVLRAFVTVCADEAIATAHKGYSHHRWVQIAGKLRS